MENWKESYSLCPRFDESPLYNSDAYQTICVQKAARLSKLYQTLSVDQWALIQEYIALLHDETEMECIHYFMSAWKMASQSSHIQK